MVWVWGILVVHGFGGGHFLPPHGLGGIVGGGGLGKTQLRRPSTIGRIQADDVEASTVAAATLENFIFSDGVGEEEEVSLFDDVEKTWTKTKKKNQDWIVEFEGYW